MSSGNGFRPNPRTRNKQDVSMGVDVVPTILGVVLRQENYGVVPVGVMGDGVDNSTSREVIVCYHCTRCGHARLCRGCMVIWQPDVGEAREVACREVVQPGVCPLLVRQIQVPTGVCDTY